MNLARRTPRNPIFYLYGQLAVSSLRARTMRLGSLLPAVLFFLSESCVVLGYVRVRTASLPLTTTKHITALARPLFL